MNVYMYVYKALVCFLYSGIHNIVCLSTCSLPSHHCSHPRSLHLPPNPSFQISLLVRKPWRSSVTTPKLVMTSQDHQILLKVDHSGMITTAAISHHLPIKGFHLRGSSGENSRLHGIYKHMDLPGGPPVEISIVKTCLTIRTTVVLLTIIKMRAFRKAPCNRIFDPTIQISDSFP